ncbi:MAG: SDR family oxidoreductase [Solirubrobacterales bacterium]
MAGRVEGKVVVITGAGGGQGRAEALALAAEGATVVATDLEAPELSAPAAGSIVCRALDVGSTDAWQELAEWLDGELGRVDGLVNNAGVTVRARLLKARPEEVEEVMRVNLIGSLLGIQTVVPLMPAGGSIVNVSSLAAWGGHYAVAYTASKWAVRGLSRVASMELGPRGIRVNTILPGYIDTAMTASASPAFKEANLIDTPLGRAGSPEEVAPLVIYLISDESSFVSGTEITIDGGQNAHGGNKAKLDAIVAAARGRADGEEVA